MSMDVTEAGRRGGFCVLGKYGKAFYSSIGKRGQEVMRQKNPGKAAEWGRMGGRPRKYPLSQMGEKGKNKI